MKALAGKLANNPLQVAIGLAVLLGVAYLLVRKTITEVADAAGGIVSGNNAITEGTAYEGKGIPGTLGATADAATGGFLGWFGELIGGGAADAKETLTQFFNPSADSSKFYTVTFPDGARHAINAGTVSRTGGFTYDGKAWQLFDDAAGKHVARLA